MTRKKAPRLLALLAVCALLTGCQSAPRTAQPTAAPVAARAVATETPPDLSGVEPVPIYQQVVTTDRVISVILEGYTEDDTMQSLVSLIGSRAPNCVFFFTGATAADSPQLVQAATAAGLEVGDYGLNVEKNLDQNSAAKNLRQLKRAQALLTEAAGTAPRLLRCNGSLYTDELLRVAAAAGLQGAVRPSAYLNHRSFSSAEDAATYVQKLVRGSVLSIKLGQELDTAEYGDQGQEL
ncbi:MAG: polysaccharide deacetylase family protein, partial [Eubacteriales bacterium]|nr:polysaccharide deacetylase family protein [Eubacteriales bacterium]